MFTNNAAVRYRKIFERLGKETLTRGSSQRWRKTAQFVFNSEEETA